MTKTLVLIVGPDRAGKSTFANALGLRLHWPVRETGHVCVTALARVLGCDGEFITPQDMVTSIIENKDLYRRQLLTMGDELTRAYADTLVRRAMAGIDGNAVVCGIRRVRELLDTRHSYEAEGYRIVVVKIERAGYGSDYELNGPAQHAYRCASVAELEERAQGLAALLDNQEGA